MSPLIGVHEISKSFGAKLLFEKLNFGIDSGERVGLIGPNGAGKSTLLKILVGKTSPDTGSISYQRGLRIGYLEQVPHFTKDTTVRETVLESLVDFQAGLEDWEHEVQAEKYMARFNLDPDVYISKLSGGWKKRVALARELAKQPDLLLLDEPTNHLDVENILWLENLLANSPFATLTITHDRLFLQRVSNRILELDQKNIGGLLSVQGNYADYLMVKEQLVHAQERREIILKNTLRRETEWLRRGPKARSTKQQSRIQRAQDLQETVQDVAARNQTRVAQLDFQKSSLPKKLLQATEISKSYKDKLIFSKLDLLLSPGTRVGLLGANGAGKSTLIRVLLNEESPDKGEVFHSDQLKVAYFEQNRDTLDPQTSLVKTLCPSGDHVEYRGQQVHIKGYLDRFLFTAAQMDLKVGKLSGGEQSRLLIAKLMLQPANLLVLDEPTNDLDLATLNVLQDCLTEFEGAILLVTHDRYFLDQVANKILAFPSKKSKDFGCLISFADLSQWETWFEEQEKSFPEPQKKSSVSTVSNKQQKLSYLEQREYDSLESEIQKYEKQLAILQEDSEKPENMTNSTQLVRILGEMEKCKTEIDRLYQRWEHLEQKA
jgi:ABC transport system ATP-binding/permease protein